MKSIRKNFREMKLCTLLSVSYWLKIGTTATSKTGEVLPFSAVTECPAENRGYTNERALCFPVCLHLTLVSGV